LEGAALGIDPTDRVAIWNAFLRLAWTESKAVFEIENDCTDGRSFSAGETPTLPEEEFHRLAAVVLCNLAIEARANHLLEVLVEEGVVSADVAESARWLPTKAKWFLLPTLAGKPNTLDSGSGPHQAVAQLCDLRNDFIHVDYAKLKRRLPSSGAVLSYYQRFVEAMEDMNVVLGRHDEHSNEVLKLKEFFCSEREAGDE